MVYLLALHASALQTNTTKFKQDFIGPLFIDTALDKTARSFCSHLGGDCCCFFYFFCNCARGLYFSGYALMSCDFGECCESVP